MARYEQSWRSKLDFEHSGKTGETVSIIREPKSLFFRGIDLFATDTAPKPGFGTRIVGIRISDVEQMPLHSDIMTVFFSHGVALNATCRPGERFEIKVKFDIDCTFSAKVIGRAVD